MKSEILHTSYVLEFLNVDFSAKEISNALKIETDETLDKIPAVKTNSGELENWEINFKAIYNRAKQILIYKNGHAYSIGKNKIREIVIHIPIPTKDIVHWGLTKVNIYMKKITLMEKLVKRKF
jgi:hypothetical protein